MQTNKFRFIVMGLLGLGALIFSIMSLASYRYYSTLGIDNEQLQGQQIQYRYYRLWWPGNGALFIGRGERLQAYDPNRNYDVFDPAGTLFQKPHKLPQVQSMWNHLGFWWINQSNSRQVWLGVPAVLPALLLVWAWWYLRKRTSIRAA